VTSIQDGEGTIQRNLPRRRLFDVAVHLGLRALDRAFLRRDEQRAVLASTRVLRRLAWTVILVFVSISEIQNYTVGQTIKSMLFTFLFVIVILLVLSFIQMTIGQLFSILRRTHQGGDPQCSRLKNS
jgi:hypothetical protein